MAQELQIRNQGFPGLLADTGAISPLQGPFWSLASIISPTYLIGADAEINTAPPRWVNSHIFTQVVNNPAAGGEYNVSFALKRGRYVFELNWYFSNGDAVNGGQFDFFLQDGAGANYFFNFLDYIQVVGNDRHIARGSQQFCCDVQTDGHTSGVVFLGAVAANPCVLILSTKLRKYAELPLEPQNDSSA